MGLGCWRTGKKPLYLEQVSNIVQVGGDEVKEEAKKGRVGSYLPLLAKAKMGFYLEWNRKPIKILLSMLLLLSCLSCV